MEIFEKKNWKKTKKNKKNKKTQKVTFGAFRTHHFFPPISTPFFALIGSFFPMGLIGRSIQKMTTFFDFCYIFRSIYLNLAPLPPKNQFYLNLAPTKISLFSFFSTFFIFFHLNPLPFSFFSIQSRQTIIKIFNARQ